MLIKTGFSALTHCNSIPKLSMTFDSTWTLYVSTRLSTVPYIRSVTLLADRHSVMLSLFNRFALMYELPAPLSRMMRVCRPFALASTEECRVVCKSFAP